MTDLFAPTRYEPPPCQDLGGGRWRCPCLTGRDWAACMGLRYAFEHARYFSSLSTNKQRLAALQALPVDRERVRAITKQLMEDRRAKIPDCAHDE